MSRKPLAVAAFILVALPLSAATGQLSFGVAAGLSSPTGDFGKVVESGYHGTLSMSINPPLAPVGFRVDGMFNEFNHKAAGSSKSRVLALTGNAVVSAPGLIVIGPYLIGGIGMYKRTISPAPTLGESSFTDLGYNLGGGIKFGLAGFAAYGEVRYHYVGDGGVRFIPVTFGVSF